MLGKLANVYGDRPSDSQEFLLMRERQRQQMMQQYGQRGNGGYSPPNRGMPGRRKGAGSR